VELITQQLTKIYCKQKRLVPATVQLHMGSWDNIISRAYIKIFPLLCLYELGITWIAPDFGNGHSEVATLVLEGWPTL